jgi:hypothetical protein
MGVGNNNAAAIQELCIFHDPCSRGRGWVLKGETLKEERFANA